MVSLLKQKAKVVINRRERTEYELADVFKKRKVNEEFKQPAGEDLASSFLQPQGPDQS